MILCPKTGKFHSVLCVMQNCDKCKQYEQRLYQYYNFSDEQMSTDVTWHSWRRLKNEKGKVQRKLVTQTEHLSKFMVEFVEDMVSPTKQSTFFEHLFVAYWQFHMYSMIKNNLPAGHILQVIDFAKNRSTLYESEVKSSFFNPTQITMHPIITFYNSPAGLVRHSITIFSNDHTHDAHAVNHYIKLSLAQIRQAMPEKFTTQVIFSDGCAAQYKCNKTFGDIGTTQHKLIRSWFGSEHGKGESDGETGIINRELDNAICAKRVIINNANDAHTYCNKNFRLNSELSKREFIYVNEGDIIRDRRYIEVKSVPKTRQIHQAFNTDTDPYVIYKRHLSCFCVGCMSNTTGECRNADVVKPVERHKLILNEQPVIEDIESEHLLDNFDDLLSMDIEDISVGDDTERNIMNKTYLIHATS